MLLLFNLYIGFRSPLAIALISVFVLAISRKGAPVRLISYWRLGLVVVFFGFFLFVVKHVIYAVKAGNYGVVVESLKNVQFIFYAFIKSEPFVVQSILNSVVVNDFETGLDHIIYSFFQFFLFSRDLGLDMVSFNSYFQPALFADVEYGMASNIWAQMWSAGGWGLLVLFLLFFLFVIVLFNKTLESRSLFVRAGFAPLACYWCFYIHRNDLGYAFNLEKRLLIILFFSYVLVRFLRYLSARSKNAV